MRAKEFITEKAKSPFNIVKKDGERQAHTPFKAISYSYGKLGVPEIPNDDGHMNVHSHSQNENEYGSLRGEIPVEAQAAMPGAFSIEDLPSDFYGIYRLGMGLAAKDRNVATANNFGKHPFIMPFSDKEHASVEKEVGRQGHKTKLRTTAASLELSTINTVSPVSNWMAKK
jgi:hypothetical protein